VHVTLRSRRERGSLRRQLVESSISAAIRGAQREDFRVVHYSIQADHLHLLVEAANSRALSRGVQRLTIRSAMGLNRRLGRRSGKLWSGRHHRHSLKSPREVRNALVYVLTNFRKHRSFGAFESASGASGASVLDPYSSAFWFDGWFDRHDRYDQHDGHDGQASEHRGRPPPLDIPLPVLPATTWLLASGWKRHGWVSIDETPAR
jgi:REP element-mobilizing transposase RayT